MRGRVPDCWVGASWPQLRRTAEAADWLDVATPLLGDPELAVHLSPVRTQPAVASLPEPHRERIARWWRQGIQGTTIHGALVRNHVFTGSYPSVRRFLAGLEAPHPQVTTVLEFDPGEAWWENASRNASRCAGQNAGRT